MHRRQRGRRWAQALSRPPPAHRAGYRRGHRGRDLRRHHLLRVRRDDPDLGERLHLCLRHPGRARRVDHRLGPDSRVRRRKHRRRHRVGGLLRFAAAWPRRDDAAVAHLGPVPIIFNLPAFAIVAVITWLLVVGTKESARVNTVMVAIKVGIIGLFLVVGLKYIRPEQWTTPSFAPNGFTGISVGAAIIFFSYIGFDAVSTASEEAKNPQKDIPFGIIASLIICTVL